MKYIRFNFRHLPYEEVKGLLPQPCLMKISQQCRVTFIKSRLNQTNCDKCLQFTETLGLFPLFKEEQKIPHTNRFADKVCKDCEKLFKGGFRSYRCNVCQSVINHLRWSNRRRIIISDTDIVIE